jgi:hypothetical protein
LQELLALGCILMSSTSLGKPSFEEETTEESCGDTLQELLALGRILMFFDLILWKHSL